MFFQLSISPIYDKSTSKIGDFVEMRDITTQQELIYELYRIINYDELTKLHNRRYFEIMLQKLNTENQMPISIVAGDLK